jgi:heme-degrading monooxygenase HmoA
VSKNSRVATHSILTIPVRTGSEEAFVDAFHRLDVFGHASQVPAFRGGELLRPQDGSSEFVVHAVWDGAEGYQAWLDAPVRANLTAEIEDLVAGPMTSRLYDDVA